MERIFRACYISSNGEGLSDEYIKIDVTDKENSILDKTQKDKMSQTKGLRLLYIKLYLMARSFVGKKKSLLKNEDGKQSDVDVVIEII